MGGGRAAEHAGAATAAGGDPPGLGLVNVLTGLRLGRDWPVRDGELFAHFLLDVFAFTGLLYFAGGSTNPFAPLYLLPITLAAWLCRAITSGHWRR